MSGIEQILDTAKKGLFVSRMAIQVTGHNIANVNTPSFSRQRLVLATANPMQSSPGMLGTGVEASEIERIFDRFISEQINHNEELAGKWKGMSDAFLSIEGIFNETYGYGLNHTLNEFWSAWQDLSGNPEGQAERANVIIKGESLALNLNQINSDISQSSKDLNAKIASLVVEINSIIDEMTQLNNKIAFIQSGGENPNDLLDQRDRLLRELSSKLGIDYFVSDDGKLAVFMARNGHTLVENITSYHLSLQTNSDGVYDIIWGNVNSTGDIAQSDGELGGLLKVRDIYMPDYIQRINEMTSALIFEVNTIHARGVGLDLFDSSITGSYQSSDGTLGGLDFGSRIEFSGKEFEIWVRDNSTQAMQKVTIDMSPFSDTSTLNDLSNDAVNGINKKIADAGLGGVISASAVDNRLRFQVAATHSFGFSGDTSHILAALGINTYFTGHDARDISMDDYIVDHREAITTARIDETTGEFGAGDNSNALIIAELQNQAIMSGGSETFDQYYASLVGDVGVKVREVDNGLKHQNILLDQLDTHKQSISGVSIDEEMIYLMKFQQAYVASARVIQQVDEMIDIIMNML